MKKVLVAGAALLLAGSVVNVAMAEVKLSGTASVEYQGIDDGNAYIDDIESEVKIKFVGTAKGGAFAKARLEFGDKTWSTNALDATSVDYAYMGIPMGPVTVYAGQVDGSVAGFSDFFYTGDDDTRVQVEYKQDGMRVAGWYQIHQEVGDPADDFSSVGAITSFGNDMFAASAILWYMMDINPAEVYGPGDVVIDGAGNPIGNVQEVDGYTPGSEDGLMGSVRLEGESNNIMFETEVSFKSEELNNGVDTGYGAYAAAGIDLGSFTPAMHVGFTADDYMPNVDYGFVMIGADTDITQIYIGEGGGDAVWAAFTPSFKVSDDLKLNGNVVYYDDETINDAYEVSGCAKYTVSEGATLSYTLGYVDTDSWDEGVFGHYLKAKIKF